jgi:hypothetical protein
VHHIVREPGLGGRMAEAFEIAGDVGGPFGPIRIDAFPMKTRSTRFFEIISFVTIFF